MGDRCTNNATVVIQVDSGKLRPRCAEHIGNYRIVTPEEENAYNVRRSVLGRR